MLHNRDCGMEIGFELMFMHTESFLLPFAVVELKEHIHISRMFHRFLQLNSSHSCCFCLQIYKFNDRLLLHTSNKKTRPLCVCTEFVFKNWFNLIANNTWLNLCALKFEKIKEKNLKMSLKLNSPSPTEKISANLLKRILFLLQIMKTFQRNHFT